MMDTFYVTVNAAPTFINLQIKIVIDLLNRPVQLCFLQCDF